MRSMDVRWNCDRPVEMSRGSAGHNENFWLVMVVEERGFQRAKVQMDMRLFKMVRSAKRLKTLSYVRQTS